MVKIINSPNRGQLPNFLIVGAAKSGTTSLYHYLRQVLGIFLSDKQKETHFLTGKIFNNINPKGGSYGSRAINLPEKYLSLFSTAKDETAIGEVCTSYLYFAKETIPNIKKYLGDPKIVIILRNPIERAYSNYLHHVRDGHESESFEQAIKLEQARKEESYWWGYQLLNAGLYYHNVKLYIKNFSNVYIYLFEELIDNPTKLVENICNNLNVDTNVKRSVITQKFNISGIPKNKVLYNLIQKPPLPKSIKSIIKKAIPEILLKKNIFKYNHVLYKPPMGKETKEFLINYFSDDIKNLQNLIARDLSKWLY